MILGYKEARQESGRFYEYEYEITVVKTEASKHFVCFKDNDKDSFSFTNKVYCWSDKSFDHVVGEWQRMAQGLLDIYSYKAIGKTVPQSFTPEQVLDRIYARNKFQFLANLVTYGSTDVIM
jgi:hypothetical protein